MTEFCFDAALSCLLKVTPFSPVALISIKIKTLLLLAKVNEANHFYSQLNETIKSEVCETFIEGLLGNLQFFAAFKEAVKQLKKTPGAGRIITLLLDCFSAIHMYDLSLALLKQEYVEPSIIPPNLLVRLAVRLQIAGRSADSQNVVSLVLHRFSQHVPTQVPWLLTAYGQSHIARQKLKDILDNGASEQAVMLNHYYFLRSECPSLFKSLIKSLSSIETENTNNFEAYFTGNKLPPSGWDNVANRMFWVYSHQYEAPSMPLEQYFLNKARLAAMSGAHLNAITYNPDSLDFLTNYASNLSLLLEDIKSIGAPVVFVTSHRIYPGALYLLMKQLPDLHFVRTAVGAYSNTSITKRAINLGPPHMLKHNLVELANMDRLLRKGMPVLLNVDPAGARSNTIQHQMDGKTVSYDPMIAPYLWDKKIRSFWIDADFTNNRFEFELSEMPLPSCFNSQDEWSKAWFGQFHEHMTERFYGAKGIGNPSVELFETMIPQVYQQDLNSIADLLSRNSK